MKIRNMKAYAREVLLHRYGIVIGTWILSGIIVAVSGILTLVSIGFALANTERFAEMIQKQNPGFVRIPALSVVFSVVFTALLLFTAVLAIWVDIGRKKIILRICRREETRVTDLFYAFKRGSRPLRIVALSIVQYVLVEINLLIPLLLSKIAGLCGHSVPDTYDFSTPWGIAVSAANILVLLWMFWLSAGFMFSETALIDHPSLRVTEALRESLRITRWKKLKLLWMLFSFIFWVLLMELAPVARLWVSPYIEASIVAFYLSAKGESCDLSSSVKEPSEEAPVEETDVFEPGIPEAAETSVPESVPSEAAEISVPEPETVQPVQNPNETEETL